MKNVLLIISAIVVLVLFCISLKNSLSVTLDGVRTTAVCTKVDGPARRSSRQRRMRFRTYHFRYTDQEGQAHSPTIRYRMYWKNPDVGESVPIVYATKSPDLIFYDSVFHIWMLPVIFGGLLIAMVVKRVIRRPVERVKAEA